MRSGCRMIKAIGISEDSNDGSEKLHSVYQGVFGCSEGWSFAWFRLIPWVRLCCCGMRDDDVSRIQFNAFADHMIEPLLASDS